MKKVLVISASPRKGGNSDTLCDKFIEGAKGAGHYVEKVFLRDKKINYCVGCGLCSTNDYTGCSQKDDMPELLEKMIDSDVIVMATPVYFYTMNGQMKTFIDRCCARYTHILNKEFYFIAAAADGREAALDRTFMEFQGFLACLDNPVEKGRLAGCGVWNKGDINSTSFPEKAYNMGAGV